MGKLGWGTWIRTKIDGVRVRSSTVELSPKRASVLGGALDNEAEPPRQEPMRDPIGNAAMLWRIFVAAALAFGAKAPHYRMSQRIVGGGS